MPLKTIAVQVCRMEAMVAFYSEAFGVRFEEVEVAGMKAFFGAWDELVIKFVPLRDQVDFDSYPIHQLGIETDRPEWVRERCLAHGGRFEDPGAIRDPDGNTIELYGSGSG